MTKYINTQEEIEGLTFIKIWDSVFPKSEYTLFSSSTGLFFKIDHLLGHRTRSKNQEIITSVFSDHNGLEVEIYHRKKKSWIRLNCLEFKQPTFKSCWVKEKVKEVGKRILEIVNKIE